MPLNGTVLLWHINCRAWKDRRGGWVGGREKLKTARQQADLPVCLFLLLSCTPLTASPTWCMVIAETCYLLCESDTFQRLIVAEKWMTLALMHLHTIRIIVLRQEQDGVFFPLFFFTPHGEDTAYYWLTSVMGSGLVSYNIYSILWSVTSVFMLLVFPLTW